MYMHVCVCMCVYVYIYIYIYICMYKPPRYCIGEPKEIREKGLDAVVAEMDVQLTQIYGLRSYISQGI